MKKTIDFTVTGMSVEERYDHRVKVPEGEPSPMKKFTSIQLTGPDRPDIIEADFISLRFVGIESPYAFGSVVKVTFET